MGSRLSPHRLHPKLAGRAQQRHRHLVNELQLENHLGILNSQDQGKLPVRHNRDVDDLDDRELRTWRCTITGMSNPVQKRHLKNLDGELHSLHCGYWSLHAKQEYPTTVDELNLGHLQVKKLLEIVAAWSQGLPPKNCSNEVPARPAPPHPLWLYMVVGWLLVVCGCLWVCGFVGF